MDLIRKTTFPESSILASLDVDSLFTNVPVYETINIILNYVYHHPTLLPPTIPEPTMKQLLTLCTTKTLFRSTDGKLYLQTDGVMMGSSLGPTFANFYMAHIEETVLSINPQTVPLLHAHARYVDDIFLVINSEIQLQELKQLFEDNSVLTFTSEKEKNNRLAFLDILLHKINNTVLTSVHTKDTSTGECINFNCLCPEKYKLSVIKTLLHRAFTVSSNWEIFHQEIENIKQRLVNNNFPNSVIDNAICNFMNQTLQKPNPTLKQNITLFFNGQFCSNYKQEENQLKDILKQCVKPTKEENKVILQVYYKIKKLKSIFIHNKPKRETTIGSQFNVVYRYTCDKSECNSLHSYIGYTEQTVHDRFRQHQSVLKHIREVHHTRQSINDILQCVSILHRGRNKQELLILEALSIAAHSPTLNSQEEGRDRILKIF